MTVTAIVLARDRPKMLPFTLQSVQQFDDVIVVYGGSIVSAEVAKEYGYRAERDEVSMGTGGFAGLKNRWIKRITTTAGFFIDDDETMRPDAYHVLLDAVKSPGFTVGWVRRFVMVNTWQHLIAQYPDYQSRLASPAAQWTRHIHELPVPSSARRVDVDLFMWGRACQYGAASREALYKILESPVPATSSMGRAESVPPGVLSDVPIPQPVRTEEDTGGITR